jgi:DNA-binding NtrC family response regulator
LGHNVRQASGPEGLDILSGSSFDLVIIDLVMPKANGLTMTARIRQEFPQTQVILISGSADIRIAVEAVKAGAHACFEKPVNFETLEQELKALKRTA